MWASACVCVRVGKEVLNDIVSCLKTQYLCAGLAYVKVLGEFDIGR